MATSESGSSVRSKNDVLLDANELKAEELKLEVAGVLKVEIKGLETKAHLEANLSEVVGLLERLVNVLEENPETLDNVLGTVKDAIKSRSGTVEQANSLDATDAAKRRAEELGISLTQIDGTGEGGRIIVEDVERGVAE